MQHPGTVLGAGRGFVPGWGPLSCLGNTGQVCQQLRRSETILLMLYFPPEPRQSWGSRGDSAPRSQSCCQRAFCRQHRPVLQVPKALLAPTLQVTSIKQKYCAIQNALQSLLKVRVSMHVSSMAGLSSK